ncbi:uncharacterized protein CDAR_380381 [Caerostris darwini]|uniref:Uncharacterized protein n=1 Tax=Caerostris darwini TaxID=1538125 RepID=A0AAV4TM71_9ARAC|nr:uncharacterized protein CDAR_380381 [Caerostris darwini]
MITSHRYEFRKGAPIPLLKLDYSGLNHCAYRESLKDKDKLAPVNVYKLYTGPILNPIRDLVQDHTYSRLMSEKFKPERGGLCKYFRPSTSDYCYFCTEEQAKLDRRHSVAKFEKDVAEMRNLLNIVGGRTGFDEGNSEKHCRNFVDLVEEQNCHCICHESIKKCMHSSVKNSNVNHHNTCCNKIMPINYSFERGGII